jgi:hypothetical protein
MGTLAGLVRFDRAHKEASAALVARMEAGDRDLALALAKLGPPEIDAILGVVIGGCAKAWQVPLVTLEDV